MNLAPQLAFAGQCRQAFEFYAELLGGTIIVMNTFGGNEDRELPPGSVAAAGDHSERVGEEQDQREVPEERAVAHVAEPARERVRHRPLPASRRERGRRHEGGEREGGHQVHEVARVGAHGSTLGLKAVGDHRNDEQGERACLHDSGATAEQAADQLGFALALLLFGGAVLLGALGALYLGLLRWLWDEDEPSARAQLHLP